MKNTIGALFLIARTIINTVTLLACAGYVVIFAFWMHAPIAELLRWTGLSALWPLGLAWLCGTIGKRLRDDTAVVRSLPIKRYLPVVVGLALAGSGAAAALKMHRQYACSIDPSQTAAARDLARRTDGFDTVCPGDLDRFDISFGALERATKRLAFAPVDLTRTPFSQFESLGGKVEYMSDVPSRLYRGFRTAEGHRLILLEHDMSADGTRSWRAPRDEPERIHGLPARLVIMEDTSGTAVSHLSWAEGRRNFELWIDANAKKTPALRDRLFALAASIPPSTPACPNEVPPKPIRIGPDGYPVDEPMPNVISEAELDAMVHASKRPCRQRP
jgi:hypothetical protein